MIDATGFITAGGQSSRMGSDKSWLEIGGQAMIEHVIAALAPVTSSIAIIANNPAYNRLGYPVFADTQPGIGPIEAVRTALTYAKTSRIVVAGCDLPFVTSDLFRFLLSISGDYQAVVPVGADGKLETLCAVYRQDAVIGATELIARGDRKMSRLFERLSTRIVLFDELRHLAGAEQLFENINTPDDYARVSARLRCDRQ